jgi:hypothetical protein
MGIELVLNEMVFCRVSDEVMGGCLCGSRVVLSWS